MIYVSLSCIFIDKMHNKISKTNPDITDYLYFKICAYYPLCNCHILRYIESSLNTYLYIKQLSYFHRDIFLLFTNLFVLQRKQPKMHIIKKTTLTMCIRLVNSTNKSASHYVEVVIHRFYINL